MRRETGWHDLCPITIPVASARRPGYDWRPVAVTTPASLGSSMRFIEIGRSQYKLSDFIGWQRAGSLQLSPSFQRRPVWKPAAKSYLVDTIVRGLPVPVIYLRERLNLDRQETIREVVDGQQRLRTLFAFVSEALLTDFEPSRDRFLVKKLHNAEIAGKKFSQLSSELKKRILGYEFSTHILPPGVEDREVLQIFARLNSTGVKASPQELRNARWFGAFKTSMYALALEQLDKWRGWGVLSENQIARMKEVEITSDLVLNMIDGLMGKTAGRLDEIYRRFDDEFPSRATVEDRYRRVMKHVGHLMEGELKDSVFTSEVHFFSLWVYLYDVMWGLGSEPKGRAPAKLPQGLAAKLSEVSGNFRTEDVPKDVLDAVQRASADTGRRQKRLRYMHDVCGT